MIMCVGITIGFRTTQKIGNAYGIAVVFVMLLTSWLLVLIMMMIWKTNLIFVILYIIIFGVVELVYFTSVLYKFDQGGYLPFTFALVLLLIMYIWNDVYRRKYYYELENKISPDRLKEVAEDKSISRMPGLAIFYSELVHGIPPIFKHYVENVPALHSVLVFVSIKSLPINKVPIDERFLFRRVEPHGLNVFRCVVRYGYIDVRKEKDSFEPMLVEKLKEFIRFEKPHEEAEKEVKVLDDACRGGIVHLIGEIEVISAQGSNIVKRVMIDYLYNFMKRNLRQSDKTFDIPHKRLLKVGMNYEL